MVLYSPLSAVDIAPSGAVTPPNTDLAPDYSIEDPTRNWFIYRRIQMPQGPVLESRNIQESPKSTISHAQKRWNKATALAGRQNLVRDDGVLDVDTLRRVADALPATVGLGIADALRESATTKTMTPKSWTGLLYYSQVDDAGLADPNAENWLRRGGFALGTTAQLPLVRFPAVQSTSDLQRSMPRVTNFVRNNKVPLAVGGGVLAVGIIAAMVYASKDDF